jgi:hypothetical protein
MKRWAIAVFFLFLGSTPLLSQPAEGVYLGLAFNYSGTGGSDFKGNTVLSGNGQLFLVPKVDYSPGFGIILGAAESVSCYEISYYYSGHNVTMLDTRDHAVSHVINADIKRYFGSGKHFQFFGLFGAAIGLLSVNNAFFREEYYPTTHIISGDVTYTEIGLNLGCGLVYYVSPKLSLQTSFVINPLIATYVRAKDTSGESWKYEIDDFVAGFRFVVQVGLMYHF